MDITTALVDADGSESLSVYIADVPDGVSFNAGTKLTSSVTLADGTTLPAGTWGCGSRTILLVCKCVRTPTSVMTLMSGSSARQRKVTMLIRLLQGPETVHVDVGIVDPSVSGSGSGNEDAWITLDLDANINAADGTENLAVYIENLPSGVDIRFADSQNAVSIGQWSLRSNRQSG